MSVRHLYKLIERMRQDEANLDVNDEQELQAFAAKHGLRHEEDVLSFTHLVGILQDWDRGIPPGADDLEDVVKEAMRYAVLPKTRGRLRKSEHGTTATHRSAATEMAYAVARHVLETQKTWCEQHPTRQVHPRRNVPIDVTKGLIAVAKAANPQWRDVDVDYVLLILRNKARL
jgi:hypothetical protein